MSQWLQGILSVIGIGTAWELFKFIYPDLKKLLGARIEAKNILYKSINPILKSSDELLGKIHSLAKNDFKSLRETSQREEHDIIYIMYLFSNFWGNLMILKLQGDFTQLSAIEKGRELLKFITTYEARRNRIIDRSLQRIMGESLIINDGNSYRLKTLYEFTKDYSSSDNHINKVFQPLRELLENMGPVENRQRVLQFGVIIHALIDHFDHKHIVVRERKSYVNKLTNKTKKGLQQRVFKEYIPFVLYHNKYYLQEEGPPGVSPK